MVATSYPGVYTLETPSGVKPISAVSTSLTMFVGTATKGPMFTPTRIVQYDDFVKTFSNDISLGDMPEYVNQFFLNGGTDCYIMRIANGADQAEIMMQTESGADTLGLRAIGHGEDGNTIRALVDYNTARPEATFNMTIFKMATDSFGNQVVTDTEIFKGLSMDPGSSLDARQYITQESRLIETFDPGALPASNNPFSQSGRSVAFLSGDGANTTARHVAWRSLLTPGPLEFEISVDGQNFIGVDIGMSVADFDTNIDNATEATFVNEFETEVAAVINNGPLALAGLAIDVSLETGPAIDNASSLSLGAGTNTEYLRITSQTGGEVYIRAVAANDAAVPLMLGSAQGGLEVGAFADARPAPSGMSLRVLNGTTFNDLSETVYDDFRSIDLEEYIPATDSLSPVNIPFVPEGTPTPGAFNGDDPIFRDYEATSPNGNRDGLRKVLQVAADAVNNYRTANPGTFFWQAEVWGSRLAIRRTEGSENEVGSLTLDAFTINVASTLLNTRYYSLGPMGALGLGQQSGAVAGSNGNPPLSTDYDTAYSVIESEVEIFNLLVLPPSQHPALPVTPLTDLWNNASVFCREQMAFLIMDPEDSWNSAQTAAAGAPGLRVGLVTDHSAVYYPRIRIRKDGLERSIGPAGTMAGIYARMDSRFGVQKAPAGLEASLNGVVGLDLLLSDRENGITNPRAVNTLRVFTSGAVAWGARTTAGDDTTPHEYSEIAIRRLALMIRKSLYYGLQWVVFEENDEPLWADIRLNVGAFMNTLFRQGAFQGATPKEAYTVQCDSKTTTQNDINNGVVNIKVSFLPLHAAEFVILELQQKTGDIQV